MREDYYTLLGVPTSANGLDIKRAYLRLVRRYHPDLNPTLPNAEERLKRLIQAYEVLRDNDSRRRYDRMLDLFSMARHAKEQNSWIPKTIARRKSGFICPMLTTLALAALILYVGITRQGDRPLPHEWTTAVMNPGQIRPAVLTADQIEANRVWAAWFWEREIQRNPSSKFAAMNLSFVYVELARSAAHRGDTEQAREYLQRAQWLKPVEMSSGSHRWGIAKS